MRQQTDFSKLIAHLRRKKPKPTWDGIISRPIYSVEHNNDYDIIYINYNYYYIAIFYDPDGKTPCKPYYKYYHIMCERPGEHCQTLITVYKDIWVHDIEDVWEELQRYWRKTR